MTSDSDDFLGISAPKQPGPFEVRAGDGRVVGPVTLDQLRRGFETGKVPPDSHCRAVGATTWMTVSSVVSEVKAEPGPVASAPSGATSASATAPPKRYTNLLDVSGSLRAYGGFLKVLGWLVGVVGVLGGLTAMEKVGGYALVIAVLGIVGGITLHATGTVIAAIGESLLALADIATNTGKMAESEP